MASNWNRALGMSTTVRILLTAEEVRTGCGAGQQANCCKFILLGEDGFFCGRNTELHDALLAGQYSAQRIPTAPYPECQLGRN